MALARYLIIIAVNLIVSAIGGFLAASGGLSIFTMVAIHIAFNAEVGGVSANDLLSDGRNPGVDMFSADPTSLVVVITMFLGGLVLLAIGLRGLYFRISAGLPEEGEGEPRTPLGKITSALICGFSVLYGCAGMYRHVSDMAEHLTLRNAGIRTVAVVEREWKAKDETKGYERYFVSLRFLDAQGETITAQVGVPITYHADVAPGDPIEIIYSADEPTKAIIVALESWISALWTLGLYAFLIIFGIVGLRRLFRLGELEQGYA